MTPTGGPADALAAALEPIELPKYARLPDVAKAMEKRLAAAGWRLVPADDADAWQQGYTDAWNRLHEPDASSGLREDRDLEAECRCIPISGPGSPCGCLCHRDHEPITGDVAALAAADVPAIAGAGILPGASIAVEEHIKRSAAPPPLDEKRLARALHAVGFACDTGIGADYELCGRTDSTGKGLSIVMHETDAREIAAAYAAQEGEQ